MRPLLFSSAALLGLLLPAAASAETHASCVGFIDTLPATISTQGVWCLRKDVSTAIASGQAIDIAANNVTIDCNDFKIGGLQAGPATQATGVRAVGRLNATVRNCQVRGFRNGVSLGGGGHAVLDSRFEGNTATAVAVSGDGGLVRGNRIHDTGGANFGGAAGVVAGIMIFDGAISVSDNQVHGVSGADTDEVSLVAAIVARDVSHGTIADNNASLILSRSSTLAGISSEGLSRVVIRNNNLSNDFPAETNFNGTPIRCSGSQVIKDNVANGFTPWLDFSQCVDGGGNVRTVE